MSDDRAEFPAVNLTNCDREPIHVLGTVQPFGFLVAVSSDWRVTRASANIADYLGVTAEQVLGQPLRTIIADDVLHTIRNRLQTLRGPDAVERLFAQTLRPGLRPFDIAVHFSGTSVIVEAEPSIDEDLDAAGLVRGMVARLNQASGLTAFFREGARQVRALTDFDRVMVYRFDQTGSGEVVAEALRAGVDSFLGLNYPASDIPAQARALYVRNIFRVIADVNAVPSPIVPMLDADGQALDQSLSVLRAVSPIHIEYLRNMAVEASLSISIVVEGRLWGLFACHHYSPRRPSLAKRTTAELFGQMFSMMLESRERREASEYENKARRSADRLMTSLAENDDLLGNAEWLGDIISDTIPADGVGVFLDGKIVLSGLAPDQGQFSDIVATLNRVAAGQVFTTDHIGGLVTNSAGYASRAAGLLAIPLSRAPRDYVVLFRAERLHSVRWAGNPNEKIAEFGPNGPRLTPRKSFEEWSELVKGKALPFTPAELRAAEALRVALLEVVLRLSESVGIERQRAHEKQELLIAELNHRVRNILALIRGLISQTRGVAQSTEEFTRTLDDRVQALARAHDQLTADRWGPARLIDLITVEGKAYLGAKRDRLIFNGPNVLVEPPAFTALALVFHELMTNAVKYGALSDSGSITLSWSIGDDGSLLLGWAESGGPAVTAPSRRGFGSTIIERTVPYDLGGTAELRFKLSGLEAEFRIPARFVARVLPPAIDTPPVAERAPDFERLLEGMRVLLVEDSMIIALDGEDALRDLGASRVVTAANTARGLAEIGEGGIDLAILDFNLGHETSLPIAEHLAARGIPFLFATGYGDDLDVPATLQSVGIVKKPYDRVSLAKAITDMPTPR